MAAYPFKMDDKNTQVAALLVSFSAHPASLSRGWPQSRAKPFPADEWACQHLQAQELLLQFSAAYMIVDFFMFLIPYSPTDVLFIGHHIMTTWWAAAPLMGTSPMASLGAVPSLQHGLAISAVHCC